MSRRIHDSWFMHRYSGISQNLSWFNTSDKLRPVKAAYQIWPTFRAQTMITMPHWRHFGQTLTVVIAAPGIPDQIKWYDPNLAERAWLQTVSAKKKKQKKKLSFLTTGLTCLLKFKTPVKYSPKSLLKVWAEKSKKPSMKWRNWGINFICLLFISLLMSILFVRKYRWFNFTTYSDENNYRDSLTSLNSRRNGKR